MFEQLQPLNGAKIGECVGFVKKFLHLPALGDAKDYPVNFGWAVIDSVVVLKDGKESHVAIVLGIMGDSIVLGESNRDYKGTVEIGRTLKMNDPRIVGYYVPWMDKLAVR